MHKQCFLKPAIFWSGGSPRGRNIHSHVKTTKCQNYEINSKSFQRL